MCVTNIGYPIFCSALVSFRERALVFNHLLDLIVTILCYPRLSNLTPLASYFLLPATVWLLLSNSAFTYGNLLFELRFTYPIMYLIPLIRQYAQDNVPAHEVLFSLFVGNYVFNGLTIITNPFRSLLTALIHLLIQSHYAPPLSHQSFDQYIFVIAVFAVLFVVIHWKQQQTALQYVTGCFALLH